MPLNDPKALRNDPLRFDLDGPEREILDTADRFARNEQYPLSARMDDEEWWPEGIFETIGAAGYFGLTASPDDGGAGADLMTSGLVLQAFARWNHALALSWVETMRTFTYRCLAAVNDLEVGGGGRGTVHALTAASVMYAAETMARVLSEAVQIHGGAGYIWESEINRLYRFSKLLEIGAGTTEVCKIIIAGELLR